MSEMMIAMECRRLLASLEESILKFEDAEDRKIMYKDTAEYFRKLYEKCENGLDPYDDSESE